MINNNSKISMKMILIMIKIMLKINININIRIRIKRIATTRMNNSLTILIMMIDKRRKFYSPKTKIKVTKIAITKLIEATIARVNN